MTDLDRQIRESFNDPTDQILDRWQEALQHAYRLARGERWNQLKGARRVSGFDARGVHLFSEAVGALQVCEQLAGLHTLEGVAVLPEQLREAGRVDADREFREKILQEAAA